MKNILNKLLIGSIPLLGSSLLNAQSFNAIIFADGSAGAIRYRDIDSGSAGNWNSGLTNVIGTAVRYNSVDGKVYWVDNSSSTFYSANSSAKDGAIGSSQVYFSDASLTAGQNFEIDSAGNFIWAGAGSLYSYNGVSVSTLVSDASIQAGAKLQLVGSDVYYKSGTSVYRFSGSSTTSQYTNASLNDFAIDADGDIIWNRFNSGIYYSYNGVTNTQIGNNALVNGAPLAYDSNNDNVWFIQNDNTDFQLFNPDTGTVGAQWAILGSATNKFAVQAIDLNVPPSVPEISHFAILLGLLSLGYVVYIRKPRQ